MDWKCVDERLIRRSELILSLDFLRNYDLELGVMNDDKVGCPFKLADRYVESIAVVHYLFLMSR